MTVTDRGREPTVSEDGSMTNGSIGPEEKRAVSDSIGRALTALKVGDAPRQCRCVEILFAYWLPESFFGPAVFSQ
jgi:hypothetical protein